MDILRVMYDMLYYAGPILFCTLGGLFAYKVNVINIGLEGMMLFGGFIGALVIFYTGSYLLGLSGAIFLGIALGLLFSFFGITKKANFIITGFAINLLAIAIGYYALALMGSTDINIIGEVRTMSLKLNLPVLRSIPVLGDVLNGHSVLTYVAFLSIGLVHFIMYHTKFGVYVRVAGESPEAAEAVGINIHKIKYAAIIVGGILSALAGVNVAVEQIAAYTPQITAGTGFIAIAAIYCAAGSPMKSSAYAILFGLMQALSRNLAITLGGIAGLLHIIPYVTVIVVLTGIAISRHKKTNIRGYAHE